MYYLRNTIFLCLLLLMLVSGCGGGSSNAENNSTIPPSGEGESEQVEVEPDPAPKSTLELVVDEDFNLNSTSELHISINIVALNYQRAYLNVCREKIDGRIDLENCILNTPLRDGRLETTLNIGNETTNLTMEIWQYNLGAEPFTYQWLRESGYQWVVNAQ